MNTPDLRAIPATALERKIVASLRRLDIVQQSMVLLLVGALHDGRVTELQVAEATHLGEKGLAELSMLVAAELPERARAS